jgi:hypothetical protein
MQYFASASISCGSGSNPNLIADPDHGFQSNSDPCGSPRSASRPFSNKVLVIPVLMMNISTNFTSFHNTGGDNMPFDKHRENSKFV